jgi:hypothetical protein
MPQVWFKDKKGGSMMKLFRHWKPKGKMYSLRCFQCGSGFLSSFNLEAPICGKCMENCKVSKYIEQRTWVKEVLSLTPSLELDLGSGA